MEGMKQSATPRYKHDDKADHTSDNQKGPNDVTRWEGMWRSAQE